MRALAAVLVVGIFGAVMVGISAGPASACSCAIRSDDSAIFESDFVFVGTPILFEDLNTDEEFHPNRIVHFEVEAVLAGNVGPTFEIAIENDGQCGTPYWGKGETPLDRPVLAIADLREGIAETHGCTPMPSLSQFEEIMESSLPPPQSEGPMAFFVPVREKWASTVALDEQGAIVAWGAGTSVAAQVAACPDAPYVVEVIADPWWNEVPDTEFRVRDLETMEYGLGWSASGVYWRRVECLSGAGGSVDVLSIDKELPQDEVLRFARFENGSLIGEYSTDGLADAVLDRQNHRVVLLPSRHGPISLLDIDDMAVQVLDGVDSLLALGGAISSDGERLAVAVSSDEEANDARSISEIVIYQVTSEGLIESSNLVVTTSDWFGRILWPSSDMLVLETFPGDGTRRLLRISIDGTQFEEIDLGRGVRGMALGDSYIHATWESVSLLDLIDGEFSEVLSLPPGEPGPPVVVFSPPTVTPPPPVAPILRIISASDRSTTTLVASTTHQESFDSSDFDVAPDETAAATSSPELADSSTATELPISGDSSALPVVLGIVVLLLAGGVAAWLRKLGAG